MLTLVVRGQSLKTVLCEVIGVRIQFLKTFYPINLSGKKKEKKKLIARPVHLPLFCISKSNGSKNTWTEWF